MKQKKSSQNKSAKEYASQTRFRLVLWFIFMLFVVGLGLVWWIYGRDAAFLGFLCLVGSAIPVGLIAFFLFGLDLFVKKNK